MEVLHHRVGTEVVVLGEGSGTHNTNGGGMGINTSIIDAGSLNVTKDEERMGNSIYFEDDTDEFSLSKKNPRVEESDDVPRTVTKENKDSEISPPEEENKPSIPLVKGKTKHVKFDKLIEESDDDEDVIELEFEREIKKLDTHTMYCPNCNTSITKVVLRKKRVKKGPPSADPSTQQHESVDLFGCSSCYSLFVPSANCFSWFWLLGNAEKKDGQLPPDANGPAHSLTRDNNNIVIEQGDCFSLFRIFGNRTEEKNTQVSKQESSDSAHDNGEREIEQGNDDMQNVSIGTRGNGVGGGVASKHPDGGKGLGFSPPQGSILSGDWKIDVDKVPGSSIDFGVKSRPGATLLTKPESAKMPEGNSSTSAGSSYGTDNVAGVESPRDIKETQGSKSVEILKSIVYGGLMESITSLSVVSSAAASDATTLNIIAIGLANLIGGLFIIVHDLRDLKNDQCEGAVNKYQEQLGRRENFILHAIFAVLSFLVFGLIPPATYGFAFDKTNDKDMTIVAVAAASLLCIILLAIGKAYIQKPTKFYIYLKTIVYYVGTAVLVSGVSYAVGDLIKKLLENFGWFNTPSSFTLSVPDIKSTNPVNWASY